ncbi:MAG: hypothetical protein RLY31_2322 [Bacteroidota bacterium]|jgi:gliding motility-associated lipoprotein GldH
MHVIKEISKSRPKRVSWWTPTLLVLAASLSSVGLSSCSDRPVYEASVSVPGSTWAYADTLSFAFGMDDTLGVYTMDLRVRHTADYPYQNLYTEFLTTYPDGRTVGQVVSLELTGTTGSSKGTCRGETCTVEIPLQAKAVFREKGTYRLSLVQYMRQDSLPGLQRFDLAVRPIKTP